MGEESWRIKTIGMHELNNLKKQTNFSLKYLKNITLTFMNPIFYLHYTQQLWN